MYLLEHPGKSGATTLWARFLDVYPECAVLIERDEKLFPLACFSSWCHRDAGCMDNLARRVFAIFEEFPNAQLLYLHFRWRDRVSLRAGLFWRDMREPRFMVMNPSCFERMKKLGKIWQWHLPAELAPAEAAASSQIVRVNLPVASVKHV